MIDLSAGFVAERSDSTLRHSKFLVRSGFANATPGHVFDIQCFIYLPTALLDGFVKSSYFVIMRRTNRTLNDYEMQHNVPLN